jgi:hypothetical protein
MPNKRLTAVQRSARVSHSVIHIENIYFFLTMIKNLAII